MIHELYATQLVVQDQGNIICLTFALASVLCFAFAIRRLPDVETAHDSVFCDESISKYTWPSKRCSACK